MFDDLRNNNDQTPFFQDEGMKPLLDEKPGRSGGIKLNGKFLGMTAFQRFIISFMLVILVMILGTMFLLVTGTIAPF